MNQAPAFDPDAFKRANCAQWDEAAPGWHESAAIIADWLRQPTDAMLNMAEIKPGMRVLDVAAGAGDQTVDIAARIGPQGSVLATDLSPRILEFAQARLRQAGVGNAETRVADGESLDLPEGTFDAAVCRLGLMLFPEPERGLRQMHRALRAEGRACTMVFSTPDSNPCVGILVATACKHAGIAPRDPYQPGGLLSLGKPGLMDRLFQSAGFRDVATTKLSAPFRLQSAEQYLGFIRSSASPIVQLLHKLDDAAKRAAWDEMRERLEVFRRDDAWIGPNELLLTVGKK